MLFFFILSYNEVGDFMLERLSNYVEDNTFCFTLYDNKIHILNFKRIITLEENYISFSSQKQKINITGNNFMLKKLLQNEMLITGTIIKIEVSNE